MIKLKFYLVIFAIFLEIILIQCEISDDPFVNSQGFFYKAYQNSSFCQPSTNEILYPVDQNEVLEIVQKAINEGLTVKAIGSRHSMTDIICTNGVPICMKKLKYMEMDEFNKIVTVGITLGGAIGTGAHGSSLKHLSSISDYVVGVKIIDGLGQIHYITESEELRAFMVHLGLLGIILEIKLTTVPQYKVRKIHYQEDDSILDQVDENGQATVVEMAKKHDFFEIFWFPSFKEVIIGAGDYVSVHEKGDAHTNFIPKLKPEVSRLIGEATDLVQRSRSYELADMVEYMTKEGLIRPILEKPHIFEESDGKFAGWPATGYSYKMMSSNCEGDECLWGPASKVYDFDNSFSMDLRNFTAIVKNLRDCQNKVLGDYALQGIYIRFSLKQKALMSKGFDRDIVHFEWISLKRKNPYQHPRLGLAAFQAMSLSLVKNFDGRAHWGKNGPYFHRSENIFACYCGNYQYFTSAMAKYDPNGLFHNRFARRILHKSNDRDTDPNIYTKKSSYHCALIDACDGTACNSDGDCASENNFFPQKCQTIELDEENLKQRHFNVCRDIDQDFFDPIRNEYRFLTNFTLLLLNIIEALEDPFQEISTLLPIFK